MTSPVRVAGGGRELAPQCPRAAAPAQPPGGGRRRTSGRSAAAALGAPPPAGMAAGGRAARYGERRAVRYGARCGEGGRCGAVTGDGGRAAPRGLLVGMGGGGRWRGGGAAAGGLGWEGARRSPGIAGRGGSSAGGEPRGAVSGTAGGSWGASVPRRGSVAGPGAAFRAALRSPRCAASPPPRCAPSAAPDGVHCPRVPSVPRPTARSSGLAVPAGRCRGSGGSLPLRWGRLCRCVRLFLPLSAAFPLPRSAIAAGGPRGRGSGGGSGRGARGRFPPVVLKSAGGGRRERPVRGGRLAGRIRCGAEGATVG